jgi:hypothetical protein
MINLFTQNAKLKKTAKKHDIVLYSFGLPAIKTCPQADKCKRYCYANKGCYKMYPNVIKAQDARLELTKTPVLFFAAVSQQLDAIIRKAHGKDIYIRIHDSGDFYNNTYLHTWRMIFDKYSNVKFYFYTKSIAMIKAIDLPDNAIAIYSLGGLQDAMVNIDSDRHAKIFSDIDTMRSEGYIDASQDDLIAIGLNKRIGLMAH